MREKERERKRDRETEREKKGQLLSHKKSLFIIIRIIKSKVHYLILVGQAVLTKDNIVTLTP